MFKGNTTVTTNDIVINKLTQILQYLRQGGKKDAKKLKKRGVKGEDEHVEQAQSIQSKYGKLPEADLGYAKKYFFKITFKLLLLLL